jgi:NAD(P)-dependent dehydrogenase (short-subunit alcohol dehydrogenase family)
MFAHTREEGERTFNVCWGGVYHCTRAFLSTLQKADAGHIVNTSSVNGAAMVDLGDPAWRGMVCVETGNVADNEVRLAADDEHQMSTAISVDAGP